MCGTLHVRWTITPIKPPQPWIVCLGCGGPRAFQASGKARLNANGRRLDGWLIYKCTSCDGTWNRPLFERRRVQDIDVSLLEALQANDPDWIGREAFNIDALRRLSPRVDEFAACDVAREVCREDSGWTSVELELLVPLPAAMRLDRLLATELSISRARLAMLQEQGALRINPGRVEVLRRRIRAGTTIMLGLGAEAGRHSRWWAQLAGLPASADLRRFGEVLEASEGIEPPYKDLQSSA